MQSSPIDAKYFVEFVKANMENPKLSDAEFRKLICDSIGLVAQPLMDNPSRLERYEEWLKCIEAVPHMD